MGYQTPDTLSGTEYLLLSVPDDVLAKAAVMGALTELCYDFSWESFGSVTPEQAANYFCTILHNLPFTSSPPGGNGFVPEFTELGFTTQPTLSLDDQLEFDDVISGGSDWDNVNHKLIVPEDSLWLIQLSLSWLTSATGYTWARVNGTDDTQIAQRFLQQTRHLYGSIVLELQTNDELELWSHAGTNSQLVNTGITRTRATLTRLA